MRAGGGYTFRDSHDYEGKGAEYDGLYARDPWARFMWGYEQRILSELLERYTEPPARALDFACGTGRITGFLRDSGIQVEGVDISESMLGEARKNYPGIRFLNADLTQDADTLAHGEYDLVTAFRFFANAEPDLRRSAMRALARHMNPQGVLIFNNHHHSGSPFVRLARWSSTRSAQHYGTMTCKEMRALTTSAGLTIVDMRSIGAIHIPKVKLKPDANMRIESVAQRLPGAWRVSENLIAVCVRG